MKNLFAILFVALLVSCTGITEAPLSGEDSTLVALLDQLDECQGGKDREQCYNLYAQVSAEYEQRNLTPMQKTYQQKMLAEAETISHTNIKRGHALMAEAHQRMAATYLMEDALDSALIEARLANDMAPRDTLDFRGQTLLLLAQIHLAQEQADSASHYLAAAQHVFPQISSTDLYRITHAYVLDLQGKGDELQTLLPDYIARGNIYCQAELTRLLMDTHAEAEQWSEAFADAERLMQITDSIAQGEASDNLARIHALQHERQMEHQHAERVAERARFYLAIIIVLALLLVACIVGLTYRKQARIAHARELEAMRLSEVAQANETQVREEYIRLQHLYYEHLYAIILPILNAHRSKNGHIDLSEDSWVLIEQNTDIVIPGFTTRLRRQHPTLSTEDVRFCCLLTMRVPNALLADVYGIAPSSVSVRKQRMKKKLDSDLQDQTIENYLNQYIL